MPVVAGPPAGHGGQAPSVFDKSMWKLESRKVEFGGRGVEGRREAALEGVVNGWGG